MTLIIDMESLFKVTAHLLIPTRSLFVKSEQDWTKGREIMVQKWISKRSTMTFTINLETWIKSLHTLYPQSTLLCEARKGQWERNYCLNKVFFTEV